MPNSNVDMGYVLRLEPKAAVDYLKSKGYNITWNWYEQLEDAHVKAFTVAKATKMEVLETIHQAVIEAVEKGISERDFIKQLTPKLQQLGWWCKAVDENGKIVQLGSPRRLKQILRTNKTVAYQAARYMEQMANSDEQPYWQYMAVKDSRTRASHLALHGKVYRADDPIWDTLYPPNDWGCRCYVRALSEFRLKREGYKVESSQGQLATVGAVAGVDEDTGEEIRVAVTQVTTPNGVMKTGAGWNYNVGRATYGADISLIRKLQQVQNPELRQQTIQAINHNRERHKVFANWVKAHLGKRGASNRYMSAGIISTDIAQKVTELSGGEKYSERLLVMTEKSLEHANSSKHHQGGIGLSEEEYASISKIIAAPDLVLWDNLPEHRNLIYIDKKRLIKIVVEPQFNTARVKPKEKLDAVINAYRVDYEEIKKQVKGGNYKIVEGEL